ncbi:MAG TPA: right-handed parallel beta-helix repeat-containing protein [Dehalococcoidia bacterium]|nr:right-handed parallel beta-helix repeat-containing protein [Dehalococcoidia bacterium]
MRERATQALLILVLLALLTLIAMVATRAQGGPLDPPAPPGSTSGVRLPGTPIGPPVSPATYPIVISAPGHYYLTGNLVVPADATGIRISASDVTLDLGGFTISGGGTGSAAAVTTFASPTRVTIANGIVRGFPGSGVSTIGASYSVIENVIATQNVTGMRISSNSVVRGCVASANTDSGIVISGSNSRVERCIVTDNAFVGVSLQNGTNLVVERSTIAGNNTVGTSVGGLLLNQADAATIRDNDFYGNNGRDVFVNSATEYAIFLNNTFECAQMITGDGVETFIPINATEPGTNRAHRMTCVGL